REPLPGSARRAIEGRGSGTGGPPALSAAHHIGPPPIRGASPYWRANNAPCRHCLPRRRWFCRGTVLRPAGAGPCRGRRGRWEGRGRGGKGQGRRVLPARREPRPPPSALAPYRLPRPPEGDVAADDGSGADRQPRRIREVEPDEREPVPPGLAQ